MTLAIALIIVAALALVMIYVTASRSLQPPASEGGSHIQPIDIEAFRNLTDPAEDAYLRARLKSSEYRVVRRQRLLAMAAYVRIAGQNASVLIHIGQAALAAGNAHTADAALQLVNNAMLLRQNAMFALCRIYVALAWPNSGLAATPVLRGYERLNGAAMLLGRLQNPTVPVRISS